MKDLVYYKLGDHPEVLQSERWCLEGTVQADKFRLGLSPFAEYKELKDYAPPNPYPELASYLSDVLHSSKPALVAKPTKKAKVKQKANVVLPMQLVLDDTDPINLVPEILRDRMDRSNSTVSNGMDK